MAVESATYINGLNGSLPNANDEISEGDDHIRLIKNVLKNTFPNISAAVNASAAEMNTLVGLVISSYMRTLLDDADAATARTTLGAVPTGALISSGLTMTSSRLLGRTTSGSGAVEELTVSGNLRMSGGVLLDTGATAVSSSVTLTSADVGTTLAVQGSSAITITLPLLSAVPVGSTINVLSTNTNSAGVTIQRQGSDVITASSTNASLTSVVLRDGDSAVFVKLSASAWLLVSGSITQLYAATRGIGYGQTWQNVTASRYRAVTYYNTTPRPIFVAIGLGETRTGQASNGTFYINGELMFEIGAYRFSTTSSGVAPAMFIVPPGSSYMADWESGYDTLVFWCELR